MTTVPKIACCLTEAVGQAVGTDGCQDPYCKFAHSKTEAKQNFFAAAAGRKVFFQKVLAKYHPLAKFFGGRLTKDGLFFTMKFEEYIQYFENLLVPMEIFKIDNFLDNVYDNAQNTSIDELDEKDLALIEEFADEQEERENEDMFLEDYYKEENFI
jgi:hypothetical protein